jgi:predicted AlkP superfamily pyrophosphatase or phosphodiesterase
MTGAAPGHQGILNNFWYERESQTEVSPSDGSTKSLFHNGRHMDPRAETLYEASNRSFPGTTSYAANEPSSRGASIATLELKGFGKLLLGLPHIVSSMVQAWTGGSIDARYRSDHDYKQNAILDALGATLYTSLVARGKTPKFAAFELANTDAIAHEYGPQSAEARAALQEADRRIGTVMASLAKRGQLDSTMFVVTADHGMEHQSGIGAGGWEQAIASSGVKAIESTRFVYIKSLDVVPTSKQKHLPGGQNVSEITVRVRDDDLNADGSRRPIAQARVTLVDASGKVVGTAVTGKDGIATLETPPGYSAQLTLVVERDGFTPERLPFSVG